MSWYKPSTWFRAKNSYGADPVTEERVREFLGGLGVSVASGVSVTESTALQVSTVFRCVNLLAGTVASLPCEVYRVGKEGRAETAPDHAAYRLLHSEACPLMTANTFWKTFMWSALMTGNGYALVSRTPLGAPTGLLWVSSHNVWPDYNADKTRLQYRITLPQGRSMLFDQDDVLHYAPWGWDGKSGKGTLSAAARAVGLAFSGQEFNERFFSQGSAADIAMEFAGTVNDEQARRIYATWKNNHTGLSKQRLPLIAEGGGKIHRLDFNAEDLQMVESRSFQVEDVCRFFGVPPHLVGHTSKSTSWGTGLEEQNNAFVTFTLRDYLKGIEQEVNRKLLRSPRYFCKFNLTALLRADSKARAEYYKSALGGTQNPGFMTQNEIRILENLPPLPGGDVLYSPVQPAAAADKGGENNAHVAE